MISTTFVVTFFIVRVFWTRGPKSEHLKHLQMGTTPKCGQSQNQTVTRNVKAVTVLNCAHPRISHLKEKVATRKGC